MRKISKSKLRFLLFISSAAMDFKEFIEDYWQIEQRSTSLSDH